MRHRAAPDDARRPTAQGEQVAARVIVVLPTYNEALNVEAMLDAIDAALPAASVLVVDDASPDGTHEIVKKVAQERPGVHLLSRPSKMGLGNAYKAGFSWALGTGFDVVCEMDCDFSHDPADLPRLVQPVLENRADLVIGSRYVPGGEIPDWNVSRRTISAWGNRYANALLHLDVADSTAGFRAYQASLLRRIPLGVVRADSYGFQVEMTHLARLAGARIEEVPIRFVERRAGTSKMSAHTVAEAFLLVPLLALASQPLRRRTPRVEPDFRVVARGGS